MHEKYWKKISRNVFDMQQHRIDECDFIGIHCVESWDNSFASNLIKNKTHVESEVEINKFFHLKDLKASKDKIQSVSSGKDVFKLKTTWRS